MKVGAGGPAARLVRPSTPADAADIASLVGGWPPNVAPEQLAWKYWQAQLAPLSFVTCEGPTVIAHAGVVAGGCLTDCGRLSLALVIDWAADPGVAGAGLALLKHVGRSFDALFAVGGSEHTRRILPVAGFQRVGTVTGFARTLRPFGVLTDYRRTNWRILPRLVRSIFWTLSAPAPSVRGWSVRKVGRDSIGGLTSVLPMPRTDLAVMERTPASLAHALKCPTARMELYVAERGDEMRGYFLLAFVPGQARIADCWALEPVTEDWAALVQLAVDTARRDSSVAEIMAWSSDPVMRQALTSCGFHRRHELPLSLRRSRASECRIPALRIQPLDSDVAYLHQGRVELLA
jgi:hypothetical protein